MSGNHEIHELDGFPVSRSLGHAEIDGREIPLSETNRTHTARNEGSGASILSYDGFLAAEYDNNPEPWEEPHTEERTSYFFPPGIVTKIAQRRPLTAHQILRHQHG